MKKIFCRIDDGLANPLFEVFDGGDFILSSWRDIEDDKTEMRIFTDEDSRAGEAAAALSRALDLVGAPDTPVSSEDVPDEDWRFAYRKHFKTTPVGSRLVSVPVWEKDSPDAARAVAEGREPIYIDPGMAFGTGRHETTKCCLEFIDAFAGKEGRGKRKEKRGMSFLDMGCGSGILSIAAAKLGFSPVAGFDIDEAAVEAAGENAALNGVDADFRVFALGGGSIGLDASIEAAKGIYPDLALQNAPPESRTARFAPADFVAANILGPLLVAFAEEISTYAKKFLLISGILTVNYPETVAAFLKLGFEEIDRKDCGEWTSALLRAPAGERPSPFAYSRPESLYKAFRASTGRSPSTWRRKNRNDEI